MMKLTAAEQRALDAIKTAGGKATGQSGQSAMVTGVKVLNRTFFQLRDKGLVDIDVVDRSEVRNGHYDSWQDYSISLAS